MKKALSSVLFLVFSLTTAFCIAMTTFSVPAQATVLVTADGVAQQSQQITGGSRHDLKSRRRRPTGPKPDDDDKEQVSNRMSFGNIDFVV